MHTGLVIDFVLIPINENICNDFVGLFNGFVVVLFIILFLIYGLTHLSSQLTDRRRPIDWQISIIIYRSSLILIVHLILIGINLIGWSANGINHVLIFELDPRSHITYEEILEGSSFLLLIWMISFIVFILCEYHQIDAHWQPLLFIFLILFLLINPLNIMHRSSRYWFCRRLFRIFSSPFHRVTFADFWIADQLTSLDLIFYDFEYLICYFIFDVQWRQNPSSRFIDKTSICHRTSNGVFQTIMSCSPSWFRMIQCFRRYYDTRLNFPHLLNALKYACGLFVAICAGLQRQFASIYTNDISNPYFSLWILSQICNSGFKFAWDLKMDWGFFDQNPGDNWFLRDELVYSRKFYYYSIIMIDFLLRYLWIIRIYLQIRIESAEYSELLIFIFALLESVRRFLWNFFRLENEHLNNCGQFRAVRDISIKPNRIYHQSTIEIEQDF